MQAEELREDDPDYLGIKAYKSAHGIERDCNTADVVVLMRRARGLERDRCAEIVQMARCAEIDQDWRTVIHFIEGGMSVDQIKKL